MTTFKWLPIVLIPLVLAGCGDGDLSDQSAPPATQDAGMSGEGAGAPPAMDTVPGLDIRIVGKGDGATAQPGQVAVVHYTGWLFDDEAPGKRGSKFDSSRDRGEPFEFRLGAGQVIQGWDKGVAGMQVGEVRELRIAPALAYGERGAGDVIPPGSTLVFEVELLDVKGQPAAAD